jgi:hypothetical protein
MEDKTEFFVVGLVVAALLYFVFEHKLRGVNITRTIETALTPNADKSPCGCRGTSSTVAGESSAPALPKNPSVQIGAMSFADTCGFHTGNALSVN